jgi:hypothetical protein
MGQALGGLIDHHLHGTHRRRDRCRGFLPADLLRLHGDHHHLGPRRYGAIGQRQGDVPRPVRIRDDQYGFPRLHLENLVDEHVRGMCHSRNFHRSVLFHLNLRIDVAHTVDCRQSFVKLKSAPAKYPRPTGERCRILAMGVRK